MNALIIMPNFYTYPKDVTMELENRGYMVDLFNEEPPKILFLVLRTLNNLFKTKFFYSFFLVVLFLRILFKRKKYDYFLVIRGNILTTNFVVRIIKNKLSTGARSAYYTWDSLRYLEHHGKIANVFTQKFSFDTNDVMADSTWKLLPLFYTEHFNLKNRNSNSYECYDLCCIASFNLYRYKMLKKIKDANLKLKFKIFLYIDKKLYDYKKKTDPEYKLIDEEWLSFEKMASDDVASCISRSRAILDITDCFQKGLSMRSIESIGLEKKIVTNNGCINNYDFYKESNVYIINETNLIIDSSWIDMDYKEDKFIKEKYSISSWVNTLL